MAMLTWAFYGAAIAFVVVMAIDPLQRMVRAVARRLVVRCPEDGEQATVWARPEEGAALHVESCTHLKNGETCDGSCVTAVQ